MRDTKSLLLILLSVGLIATWIYHLSEKFNRPANVVKHVGPSQLQDSSKNSIHNKEVLQPATDSIQMTLQERLAQIEKLKKEIAAIISNKNATLEDLKTARRKRDELQLLIDQLNDENRSVVDAKDQLAKTLDQLSGEVEGLKTSVVKLTEENKLLIDKVNAASVFVASELNLQAIAVSSGKEEPTTKARNTDKFIASFILQNNVNAFPNAEAIIVVIRPDGLVERNNVWDSGAFDTRAGTKKYFTRKVKFDYEKGEQKKIALTLDVQDCIKGSYVLQLWQGGVMIGQVNKILA